MECSKSVVSPIDESTLANSAASEPLDKDEHARYRSIIGSLMYIAMQTKRNLLVVTSLLASYLHEPTSCHMIAAKRALRYLNGMKKRRLVLKPGDRNQLTTFVDASWGNSYERERRTRSGMLVKFGVVVVAVATGLQKCVSLSPTEEKCVALNEAVKLSVWLKVVILELGLKQEPPRMLQDNIRCIEWAIGKAAKHFAERNHI